MFVRFLESCLSNVTTTLYKGGSILKKFILNLVTLLVIICLLYGLYFDRMSVMYLGVYLHFSQEAYISLDEYYNSKKVTARTIYYLAIFFILTGVSVYSALFL